jgi:hypothetical protein
VKGVHACMIRRTVAPAGRSRMRARARIESVQAAALGLAAILAITPAARPRGAAPRVSDYHVATGWLDGWAKSGRAVCLRAFSVDGQAQRLVVDPETLATRVLAADQARFRPAPWPKVRAALGEMAYGRALSDVAEHERAQQGAGLSHLSAADGISLTVDLCPSRHPLDRGLFSALIRELGEHEQPVPVAVAVTGLWMNQHPRDLDWLLGLECRGQLALTWINHSYSHRVDPRRRLAHNFLLEPGTDVLHEVLATEAALIERGITPSVFFRFPGLVSSPELVETILGLGLIPTGSDAWLGKGEPARPGSIVLVHGTGNEPVGVRRFIALLRRERTAVRNGRWFLLDLRESVAEGEGGGALAHELGRTHGRR